MKPSLRKRIRGRIAAIGPAAAHAKSMAACKNLMALPEFAAAEVVMIYLPMPDEVDVSPIALRSWQQEKTVAAPKLAWESRRMVPIEIRSLETGLVTTGPGIREPADGELIVPDLVDLVVVPGLAFDRKGNRLGRGAGFYDRFLGSGKCCGATVGIGFTEQLVAQVPVHANDVAMHLVVTDEEVLRFAPTPPRRGAGTDADLETPSTALGSPDREVTD